MMMVVSGSLGAFGANSPPSRAKGQSPKAPILPPTSLLSTKGRGSSSHRLKGGKFSNLAVFTMAVFVAYHSSKIIHSGSFGFLRIRCFGGGKASHCFRCKRRWASSAGEKVERHRNHYWIVLMIYQSEFLISMQFDFAILAKCHRHIF